MLTEPVTSPKRDFAKILAGISSAIVVFLFRYFGEFEMGFASALIVMNVFSPIFDSICENVLHVLRHKDAVIASFIKKRPEEKAEPVLSETSEEKSAETETAEEIISESEISEETEEPSGEEAAV